MDRVELEALLLDAGVLDDELGVEEVELNVLVLVLVLDDELGDEVELEELEEL